MTGAFSGLAFINKHNIVCGYPKNTYAREESLEGSCRYLNIKPLKPPSQSPASRNLGWRNDFCKYCIGLVKTFLKSVFLRDAIPLGRIRFSAFNDNANILLDLSIL